MQTTVQLFSRLDLVAELQTPALCIATTIDRILQSPLQDQHDSARLISHDLFVYLNSLSNPFVTTNEVRKNSTPALVLTQVERKLLALGHDVIYTSNKVLPLELTLVVSTLASLLECNEDVIELKEVIGEGIINRVFIVKKEGTPHSVLKVIPSYSFWKKRKCENEVFAMEVANDVLSSFPEVNVPQVICYQSNAEESPFGREFILMSFAQGTCLSSIDEDHLLRPEINMLVAKAEKMLEDKTYSLAGNFYKNENGEIVIGPPIEFLEGNSGVTWKKYCFQILQLSFFRVRNWLVEEERKKIGFFEIEDEIEKFMENYDLIPELEFDFPLGFLHDDLDDPNIIVDLVTLDGIEEVGSITLIDFEWAHSGPVSFPENSTCEHVHSLMWSVYSITACTRWSKLPEQIKETKESSVADIKNYLQLLRKYNCINHINQS